jgi:two-component system, OmpR family, sensor kinase
MVKTPRTSRKIALVVASLGALWVAVGAAISLFTIHIATATQSANDALFDSVTSGAARLAFSMEERGRSSTDIVSAISALAKNAGIVVTATTFPGGPPPPRSSSHSPDHELPGTFMMQAPGFAHDIGPFDTPPLIMRLPGEMLTFKYTDNHIFPIIRNYVIAMSVLLLFALGITWTVSDRLVRRALAPVETIEGSLRRLAEGEYSRLEMVGHDPGDAAVIDAYNAAADEMASSIRLRAEAESNLRQFVAEAGHELRTPLTVIMGFVDVLRQGAIAEVALAQRILDSVAAEGERMRLLIARLLLLARLDSIAPERHEAVDLSLLVAETVDSLKPVAGATKLVAAVEPGVLVIGSQSELREIVGNLLDNAIKYAPGSNVRAGVHRNERFAELSVQDDGPGMSAELRARAFDRFSRGDERGSVPGSGLGLAIVKRVVTRAGGNVDLDSAPGKGTTVKVRLPLSDGQSESSLRSV